MKVIHSNKYQYDGIEKVMCRDKEVMMHKFVNIIPGHSDEVIFIKNARYVLKDDSIIHFDEINPPKIRTGLSNGDENKDYVFMGVVREISNKNNPTILIRDVCMREPEDSGSSRVDVFDHVWICMYSFLKEIKELSINEDDYIYFCGKPYRYIRKNNTEDYSISVMKDSVRKISHEEYKRLYNMI